MSTMAILSILPVVGSLAASLFMPFGTVFLGRAVKVTMQGKQPGFALLAEIFRDARHRRALFNVGLVFAVALSLTNLVFDWLAADAVAQWGSLENGRLDWSTVSQHIPYDAMIAAAVIYIPALMATWFAPLLVSEKSMSAGKALFRVPQKHPCRDCSRGRSFGRNRRCRSASRLSYFLSGTHGLRNVSHHALCLYRVHDHVRVLLADVSDAF